MTPTAAAWVRQHAWTNPVRTEAKHSHSVIKKECACQRSFTSAACAGKSCGKCQAMPIFSAESVLIGPGGWVYDLSKPKPKEGQTRAMWVWLPGPICFTRCGCACHGRAVKPTPVAAAPVQLDLFAGVAS